MTIRIIFCKWSTQNCIILPFTSEREIPLHGGQTLSTGYDLKRRKKTDNTPTKSFFLSLYKWRDVQRFGIWQLNTLPGEYDSRTLRGPMGTVASGGDWPKYVVEAEHRKRPGETGKNIRFCITDTAPEIFKEQGRNDKHRCKGLTLSSCPISILWLSREILISSKFKE